MTVPCDDRVRRAAQVAAPDVEVDHVEKRQLAAVVEVRGGELDVAEAGDLEGAVGRDDVSRGRVAHSDRQRGAERIEAAVADVVGRFPDADVARPGVTPLSARDADQAPGGDRVDRSLAEQRAGVAEAAAAPGIRIRVLVEEDLAAPLGGR
jgi:hypothetical protein